LNTKPIWSVGHILRRLSKAWLKVTCSER